MRQPNHEELMRLLEAIDKRKLRFNRFDVQWSAESKTNWDSFNLGLDTAREEVSDLIAQLELQNEN